MTPQDVKSIVARVHPSVIEKVNRNHPSTGLEGKFSLHHCIALGLIEGTALPDHFSDSKVNEPAIATLRDRVTAIEEPMLSEAAAVLDVVLQNGRSLSRRVIHPTRSPLNPVSDSQLEGKFKSLVGDVLPMLQTEQLMNQLWELDSSKNIQDVLRLTAAR